MNTEGVNFFVMAFLVAEFFDSGGIPNAPSFVVAGCEEDSGGLVVFDGVNAIGVGFDFY
jgi:hypothetical protein